MTFTPFTAARRVAVAVMEVVSSIKTAARVPQMVGRYGLDR